MRSGPPNAQLVGFCTGGATRSGDETTVYCSDNGANDEATENGHGDIVILTEHEAGGDDAGHRSGFSIAGETIDATM